MITALCHATIITGETTIEGHALLINDGKVFDIVRNNKVPGDARRLLYPERLLAPGLIDVQVNGGGNMLFNQSPTIETALAITRAHRAYGTTRLLLTCITDHFDVAKRAVVAMREARTKDAGILGIHIEGPHLSQAKRGIHQSLYIRPIISSDMQLYARQGEEVLLLTVAPENVAPEQIAQLKQQGVIISLGHTDASSDQVRAALRAGATGFTHLYNGMSGLSGRIPGVAGIALDDTESWCGLIVDNHHVSPEMARIAIRAKPRGKIFLVSDAMPPAATDDPKSFMLYQKQIKLDKGRCVDDEGRLAGASITLAQAVRNCVKIGIDTEEALRMASTYQAAFLGQEQLGKLLPGYIADITVMDHQLRVEATWLAGIISNLFS